MSSACKAYLVRAASAGAAAMLLVFPAMAELRIGVVDIGRLIDQAPQTRSVSEALQDEFAPRQREIVSRQNELAEQQERLERDAEVMGAEERRALERRIRDGQRELERRHNEFVEDLNLRRNEELGALQRSLLIQIQSYADDADYDLIIGEGIIYASSSVDITSEVLRILEENYEGGAR